MTRAGWTRTSLKSGYPINITFHERRAARRMATFATATETDLDGLSTFHQAGDERTTER